MKRSLQQIVPLQESRRNKDIQQLLLELQHHLVCSGNAPKRHLLNFDLCLPLELKPSHYRFVFNNSCNLFYKMAV